MDWAFCADPDMMKACLYVHRCTAIIDMMAMHTLYGVTAFTEAELREACRFLFDVFLFRRLLLVHGINARSHCMPSANICLTVMRRAIHTDQFSGTSSRCRFLVPVAGRRIEHALY